MCFVVDINQSKKVRKLVFFILKPQLLINGMIGLISVLGGFVLILGLYSVLWGKNREHMPKGTQDVEQQASAK